jgi:Flp pilus assembly protein TadD
MKCKVHIVNTRATIALLLMLQLTSCQTVSRTSKANEAPSVQAIESALAEGRYYQARKMTEELLQSEPESDELKMLMGKVLEKEIAEQKQAFEENVIEEYEGEDKDAQILTWLDRAREFYHQAEYEQALLSAEEVFKYDPTNAEASRIIDEVKKQIHTEGKQEAVFLKHMYKDEIAERVERYKTEAKEKIQEGNVGQAKLILEKALLLDSTDKEISHMYKQLQNDNGEKSA